jgi:diacylglycerol kinase (ATP)
MKRLLASFRCAFRGLGLALLRERNMALHLFAAGAVCVLGAWRGLRPWGWAAVALCCGLVFAAELFNSAIERLCDLVSPERSRAAGELKDIAAGAVLVCAVCSLAVAAAVFIFTE